MTQEKRTKHDDFGGIDDWKSLLGLIKNRILLLPKEAPIPRYLSSRLSGLSRGQYIGNNKIEQKARYQYKVIHEAFKIAEKVLKEKKDITDSYDRLAYALTIVEKKINDIAMRREAQEKANEKLLSMDFSHHFSKKAKYIPRSTETPKSLEHLW